MLLINLAEDMSGPLRATRMPSTGEGHRGAETSQAFAVQPLVPPKEHKQYHSLCVVINRRLLVLR